MLANAVLFLSQIAQYHRERKNTIIIVSHSMEDIAQTTDRIIVMNHGKLEMFDTPKKVFSQVEKLESMGLRVPEITRIMLELKKEGYDVPSGILTVEQAFVEIVSLLKKEGKI